MRRAQPGICRQWFEELEPAGIAGGVLYVRAHSMVHRDYLHRACSAPFNEAAQTATGLLISVRFLGPSEDMPAPERAATSTATAEAHGALPGQAPGQASVGPAGRPGVQRPAAAPATGGASAGELVEPPPEPEPRLSAHEDQLAVGRVEVGSLDHLYDDGLVLNPDLSFDHFIVGPSNRLAHAAALAVPASPGRAYNPYFVHGGVGLGKTHLLQAICLAIKKEQPGALIYYTSCEGFMTQFIDAVKQGLMSRFRHKFRHVDVLVVDDIHFLAKRDRSQEEFFHTFNALYQSHKQIVLSSDAAPEDIPDLEERLVSRFKWGLVTNLSQPCYETRVEILRAKAALRGIDLAQDVAAYVAAKIDTNVRELEGAVLKLQHVSLADKRPIDVDLAKTALGDDADLPAPRIQIQTIISAVTDFFGVKVTDLQSKRRQRSIAQPRQLCMWLARKHTRYSLEEIGGFFGGRDHTTVMHAVKTIDDRCETDSQFAGVVRTVEDRVRAPAV